MQISQRRNGNARCAEMHAGTGRGIEHPGRHHRYDARGSFQMDNCAAAALFAVVLTDAPPMQRVPAIVDDDVLPDMGRMTP